MVQDFEKRFPLAYKYQNTSFDWANIFNPQAGYDELMDLLNSHSFEHDVDYLKSNWERIGRLFYDKIIEGYENELLKDSLTPQQRERMKRAIIELKREKEKHTKIKQQKQVVSLGFIVLLALLVIFYKKNKQ